MGPSGQLVVLVIKDRPGDKSSTTFKIDKVSQTLVLADVNTAASPLISIFW